MQQRRKDRLIQDTKQRNSLITVDKRYSMMNPQSKKQVQSLLQNQLDYLLGKKQIEKMKQQKIHQLQQSYERQRIKRLTYFNQKLSNSERNRSQNLREKQSRSRQSLQYISEKMKKIQKKQEQELQKMISTQKDYLRNNRQSRGSAKSLTRSESSQRSLNFNPSYLQIQLEKSLKTIDTRIEKIQTRIQQAKTSQRFHHQLKSQKAKLYSKDVNETLGKIQANYDLKEQKCIRQYHSRITHILDCQQKTKTFYLRESERRRKDIDDRFKRCNENLKIIARERDQKLKLIQTRIEKVVSPKTSRQNRSGIYLQKLAEKNRQFEAQKLLKSQRILAKHINLSLKNKAIREKKDRIFQTLRADI